MQILNRRSGGAEASESGYLDAAVEPPRCRKEKGCSTSTEKRFLAREPPHPTGLHASAITSLWRRGAERETPGGCTHTRRRRCLFWF